jgi:hypothetical protein
MDQEGLIIQQKIAKSLGSFRAENLERKMLFDLYTAPSYFPELLQSLPCFLQGGRGTGKTTVLRYLSYESPKIGVNEEHHFHGLYIKFERSEISSFQGADCDEDFWTRVFSHYINLIQSLALLEYIQSVFSEDIYLLDKREFQRFLRSLSMTHLDMENENNKEYFNNVIDSVYNLIIDLQNLINRIQDIPEILTSTLSVPLRFLIKSCDGIPQFKEKQVAFLFDEYEVLENYQQRIINTLVKQADARLTYKIGVREEGIKERLVIGGEQEIRTPADYALVSIEARLHGTHWNDFATKVVTGRLTEVWDIDSDPLRDLYKLFPNLTIEEEAYKLDVKKRASILRKGISGTQIKYEISDYEIFFAEFIAKSRSISLIESIKLLKSDEKKYKNLRNNYEYSSLFTLKERVPGITKYYCGWQTLLYLANGNIRYLLQLVSAILIEHTRDNPTLSSPVSHNTQTECCSNVGNEILRDSEGISLSGARLMKLVLALGQVFHELAVTPIGHAPEITQFEISNEATAPPEELESVRKILRDAVMHLALVRASGTKLGGDADTRTYDYMLHPIFSAFFKYSYRRKRKMGLSTSEIMGLIENPKPTIAQILKRHKREVPESLPGQLQLFGGFFENDR